MFHNSSRMILFPRVYKKIHFEHIFCVDYKVKLVFYTQNYIEFFNFLKKNLQTGILINLDAKNKKNK